jgi:hypothetical protein
MNDQVHNELKIVVERSVRPVRASFAHKRRMREEFLSHLTAIYEQEFEKLGDARLALDRAKQRFGDPKELGSQLQDATPRLDRYLFYMEKMNYQPGESILHFIAKTALIYAIGIAFLLLVFGIPALLVRGRLHEIGILLYVVCFSYVLITACLLFFYILMHHPAQSLYMKGIYCLVSLLFLPGFIFLCFWVFTGDLAASLSQFYHACYFAPAGPIVLFTVTRAVADELRYKKQWANLKIDE